MGNLSTETGTITASTYDAAGRLKTRNFTGNVVTTNPDGMIQTVTSPSATTVT